MYKEVKCNWTREIADDIISYYSINAEEELIMLLKLERVNQRKNSIRKIYGLQQT